jgi:hypothetical protein
MFAKIREYLFEMNVPTALADQMEAIPPEQIKYLSYEEETTFLLNQDDPAYDEKLISQNARDYGVSTDLYRQRLVQTNAECGAILANIAKDPANREKLVLGLNVCTQSHMWGLSGDEYSRRKGLLDALLERMGGASDERIRTCTIEIMAEGKKSCD